MQSSEKTCRSTKFNAPNGQSPESPSTRSFSLSRQGITCCPLDSGSPQVPAVLQKECCPLSALPHGAALTKCAKTVKQCRVKKCFVFPDSVFFFHQIPESKPNLTIRQGPAGCLITTPSSTYSIIVAGMFAVRYAAKCCSFSYFSMGTH